MMDSAIAEGLGHGCYGEAARTRSGDVFFIPTSGSP